MLLSKYLKIYHDKENSGKLLLYSTKRGSAVRLSEEILTAAASDALPDGHCQTLTRLGMLVESHEAEQEEMSAVVSRANSRNTLFKATIVLNLECNLACSYCYEEDFRGNQSMASATAERLIAWITDEHLEPGRDLYLQFYGGEPLLSLPLIHRISTQLQRAAASRGRKFSIAMTTNGTLLTRTVVEQLLTYNFTKAIITLDGPREIHDQQRPYVSGKGSFDTIVANIREIHDLVTVELNGNYTSKNYRQFPELLDYLLAEGLKPENLGYVQFSTVTPKSGNSADISSGCSSSSEPWLREAVPFLNAGIIARGFKTPKPTMAACMVEFEHDLVINYDGSFYKCAAFMGWPELSVGSLSAGLGDYSVSHNLTLWQNDECLDCAYLPLCFGGCRLNPLLKNGSINELDCRREFFDATLEQLVRQNLSTQ